MCLDVVYRGKEKREALAKLPDEFKVWKELGYNPHEDHWTTYYNPRTRIREGRMKAPYTGMAYVDPHRHPGEKLTGSKAYRCGWHAYIKSARDRVCGGCRTKCIALKKDILAIGEDGGDVVVVLSHITFPKKCGKPKDMKVKE